MMSYQFELDPKSDAATRLIAAVGEKLQEAFLQEKALCKLSLQGLAKRIGVDRSHLHRVLNGHNNMTLRTLAEAAWGLDREVEVVFRDPKVECWNDYIGFSHAHAIIATERPEVHASSAAVIATGTAPTNLGEFSVVETEDA